VGIEIIEGIKKQKVFMFEFLMIFFFFSENLNRSAPYVVPGAAYAPSPYGGYAPPAGGYAGPPSGYYGPPPPQAGYYGPPPPQQAFNNYGPPPNYFNDNNKFPRYVQTTNQMRTANESAIVSYVH
jgi:hypothetical protein